MKILGIGGRNLASLADAFVVDFRLEPLLSSGLFAICGPTGAGKSTLLDALCLALFDDTPRIHQAGVSGPIPEAHGDLPPRDPRTLLTRGAAQGEAWTEFLGNDGEPYRATWSVRRARSKNLQNTEMTLVRLRDQQLIGRTKTEVLEEIARRIGLDFTQFTRAVLLAQNEFTTFLKAKEDERAALLQTLTGTDTFEQISRRAYLRWKQEHQALEDLEHQLGQARPLEADARAVIEAEQAALHETVLRANVQVLELEGHLRWYQDLESMKALEVVAGRGLAEALTAQEVSKSERHELQKMRALEPARPKLRELERVHLERVHAQDELLLKAQEFTSAREAHVELAGALEQAKVTLRSAEQAKEDSAPLLKSAQALEVLLTALEPEVNRASLAHQEAAEAVKQANAEAGVKELAWHDAQAERDRAAEWLASHADLRRLGEEWPLFEARFTQAAAALKQLAGCRGAAKAAEEELQEARARLEQERAAGEGEQERAQEAQNALEVARARALGFDPEAIALRRKACDARRSLLVEAEALLGKITSSTQRRGELEHQGEQARATIEGAEAALKALKDDKPGLVARYQQAERSWSLAQQAATKDAEELRASLVRGEPCPVCGAREHPFAEHAPLAGSALRELRREVERLLEEKVELERGEAEQGAILRAAQDQLRQLEADQRALADAIASVAKEWAQHPISGELSREPLSEQVGWLLKERQALTAQLKGLDDLEQAARRAREALEDARNEQEKAAKRVSAARQRLSEQKSAQQVAEKDLEHRGEGVRMAEESLAAILLLLDDAYGDQAWRAAWQQDPAGFQQRAAELAGSWRHHSELRGRAEQEALALKQALAGLMAVLLEREQILGVARDRLASLTSDLEEKRQAHLRFFSGRATREVEAALEEGVRRGRAEVERQASRESRGSQRLAAAAAGHEQAADRVARLKAAEARAEADLDGWLLQQAAPSGPLVDRDALRRLLSHDASWVAQKEAALRALDDAVQQAQGALEERRKSRELHDRARPTPLLPEALKAELAKLQAELEASTRRRTELDVQLHLDDQLRRGAIELSEQVKAQATKAELWGKVNELIGSADGKKFRNLAQQLTLDVLVAYANRHLLDLARRYELRRIPDTLSLLVVDRDMGGELRTVHSLSGGESFLVSLALALALASISSHQVQVESLFIDEGFGSLDAETLRLTMDALDRLQAHGRKVGVISHVPEMTERIGTRIEVQRRSGGRSEVKVCAG